jgi:hypothetical protein
MPPGQKKMQMLESIANPPPAAPKIMARFSLNVRSQFGHSLSGTGAVSGSLFPLGH